ncbi:hypothetical protein WA026_016620 [Henosepilachna vigintioctopunctata]|uniref:Uncharacterized protein n=1 Tax=Henosepilachna vigintioctopunctata TaxID=420089 RepID=A0AAW1V804_9CUCU
MEKADTWRSYATICRLCLQKDGFMFGIFNHNNGKEKSLYKKIVDCTALQIAMDDGFPNVICHRCLYKIEFCLEFRQQCFVSDATLRSVHSDQEGPLSLAHTDLNFHNPEADVVMVVDPNALDYTSDVDAENGTPSENEINTNKNDYGFSNISMCRFCDQAFMNKEECSVHESSSHNINLPYSCSSCNVEFENRMHYLTHMKNVHQDDKPFKCPQCSRTFARRSDLRKHTIGHTGIKPFTCKVCSKSFSRNTNLSKHMRIHSGHKLFTCKKCHKKFLSKADLAKHAVHHSKIKTKKSQASKKNRVAETFDNNAGDQKAENCNGSDFDDNKNNVSTADDNTAPTENMIISLDPFNQDNFQDREDDQVSNSSKISDHNTDYERIMSSLAQQDSYYAGTLQSNQKSTERPFICTTCNKSFIRKRELDRHIMTHTGMKPFKCTKCEKSFGRKDKLVRHTRIHDVNKQFTCDLCDETFSRRETLTQHRKIYHTDLQNELF